MMRAARGIDDRAVPEDRSHIGTPAPGYDLRRRWQYAEDGACVAASARNVLGAADSTPVRHVSADPDKNAPRRGIQPRARAASRVITRHYDGSSVAPVTPSPVTRHPDHERRVSALAAAASSAAVAAALWVPETWDAIQARLMAQGK